MARGLASITLWLCLVALAACAGSGSEKKLDYRAVPPPPPLEVPPDLVKPADDPSLSVPAAPTGSATFSGYAERLQPKSGGGAVLPVPENIQVVRAGMQRWLVIRAQPEQLWPVVREFFPRHGLAVAKANPATGVIETDWAENRANAPNGMLGRLAGKVFDNHYSSGTRDKFRLRLERGSAPGTTEIYLSHRGLMEVVEDTKTGANTRWQVRPSDPELEVEMLILLMTELGVEADRARSQLSEANVREGARLEGDDRRVLKVYDQRDSTWRRIGLTLDRGGWTVTERDRGRRYAVAAPPAFSFPEPTQDRRADTAGARYEIVLTEEGSTTTVQVRPLERGDAPGGQDILSLLYDQLK